MRDKLKGLVNKYNFANLIRRYKFVAIVMFAGVILLLLPSNEKTEETKEIVSNEEIFSVDEMEDKLEKALMKVEGAGTVQVVLTLQCGTKYIYAQDSTYETDEDAVTKKSEIKVISSGSGTQEAIRVQQIYPEFLGALVVAEGGDNPTVRLKLTEAVSVLTGLGADKISICKGK